MKKIKGVLALSRWIEVYDFNLVVTFLGAILASGWVGWRLVAVCLANYLTLTFIFMFNDVEDAEEDAHNPKKLKRNPLSNGSLTRSEGYLVSGLVAFFSFLIILVLAIVTGRWALLLLGFVTLLNAFLYNWRRIRLKAIPVLDMISHMLGLAGLQFLLVYFSFNANLNTNALLAFIFLMIFSCYGQLDNEIRDYATDVKTHIKTTAVFLGRKLAIALQIFFLISGSAIVIYYLRSAANPWPVIFQGILITAVLLVYPLILYFQKKPFATVKTEIQRMVVMSGYINLFLYLMHFRIFS